METLPWSNQDESYIEAFNYVNKRRKGIITSFRTPWSKVNEAGVDGFEWHSMNVIAGRPGCLSGDTEIWVSRDQGHKRSGRYYTLAQLYEKFNNLHPVKWNLSNPTFINSFKYDQNLTGLNKVQQVLESGIKKTWLVTTESGKQIRATAKQPFLTNQNNGFTKLKNLKIGDFVYVRGKKEKINVVRSYRKELGGSYLYYPNARKRTNKHGTYYSVQEQRAAYDAGLNNLSILEFLKIVSTEQNHQLQISDKHYEVHHIDGNTRNNTFFNLMLLSRVEHARIHGLDNRKNLGLNHVIKDKIISIKYFGKEMTYDINMTLPYDNFIANGFVVHNTGKTLIKDQMIREITKHNQNQKINVLEFQFEMVARASKVREFCSVLGKPYKYVCSAESEKLSESDLQKLLKYSQDIVKPRPNTIDIVEKPCTVEHFAKIVELYMEKHSTIIGNVKQYVNTVIPLDHSLLLLKSKAHSNKTDMLYDLGETITKLKRKYPIVFIILSQLARGVESPERNENGKYGNYILESDIFGGKFVATC